MDSLSPNASQAQAESYTLYTADGSGGDAVGAALKLIGAPYEKVEIATWESEENRDRMAKINPMRQIPALVLPGGELLTESAAPPTPPATRRSWSGRTSASPTAGASWTAR